MKPKFWLVLMGLMIGFYSCDKSETILPPIHITGLTLDKNTLSLVMGTEGQLKATIAPAEAEVVAVKWASSAPLVATVTGSGNVVALTAGTTNITAVVGSFVATCVVTVTESKVAVTGVALGTKTLSLGIDKTETLVATVAPATATDPSVGWSSSDPLVATVSQSGVVTALAVGTATITVTTTDGAKSAICAVTVSLIPTVITLNKTTLVLPLSTSDTLIATVVPTQTDPVVTWSSSDPLVATVSQSGEVSALKVGQTTVTATCDDQSATCEVTVSQLSTVITLDKTTLMLPLSTSDTLIATVISTQTDPVVTWSSSDPLVATVSQSGEVLALKVGQTTVTATCDGQSATCAVTVSQLPTVITLNKTTLALPFSTQETLVATVVPTQTDPVITWSSSDPLVATVSQSGEVLALKVGQAIVTATCDDQSATCAVTVSQLPTVITLNKTTLTLPFSTQETLVATVVPTQTDPVITWSSSDLLVATVSQSGEVSALKVGQAIVTATCDGQSATCAVTVDPSIYVVGAKSPSADPLTQALLWVNGKEHLLSDPTKVAIAQSVFVFGSDVYVAGNEADAGKVWKNGQSLYTFADASARSVFVATDGVVYMAGFENVSGNDYAQIWRNGNGWRSLSINGHAHSIFVSGDDFYAVGVKSPNTPVAVLWKEVGGRSSEVILPSDGQHWSYAHSVVVSGNDVYVGGQWYDASDDLDRIQAVVWKNERLFYDLSTPGRESGVNSLAVSGGDLYAVGYGDRNSTTGASVVKVWKNGQLLHNLSNGTTFAEATGVVVARNGAVYVVGFEGYAEDRVAKVWRNGALLYALSNGATRVTASAIALREQ